MVIKTITRKKNPEIVNEKLLNSFSESDTAKEPETKYNRPKRSYWYNQALWKDYKDNKINGNARTDAEKV